MTYKEAIELARQRCDEHQIHPELARRLMVELCSEYDINLYIDMDILMDPSFEQAYFSAVDRLVKHEPLGYVLGFDWFFGYRMDVNPSVLIPREETEELVAHVLADIDEYFMNPVIADVATGSGAIAIALKKESPTALVFGSDISADALAVAQHNAANNNADVEFFEGDMGQPFIERNILVDILVCNPPYIGTDEEVETSVEAYEPHLALYGGEDGLKFYRQVLKDSLKIVRPESLIAFEIGYQQQQTLRELALEFYPDATIICRQDINGLDRMLFIYNNIKLIDEA